MRVKGRFVLSALIAVSFTTGVGLPVAAEKPERIANDPHVVLTPPPIDEIGTRASGGGGRSRDFTGDGIPDILARSGAELFVYPNSGSFDGTATYPARIPVNSGWGSFSWIGAADLSGDGFADIVAVDGNGVMYVAEHSGTFNGTSTFKPGLTAINSGWHIHRLVFVYDYDGDGFDDVFGLSASLGVTSVYYNNGGISGMNTLRAPVVVFGGGSNDTFQGVADVTMDGSPEFIYVWQDDMYAYPLDNGSGGYWLGSGWGTLRPILLSDVDGDELTDILGRRSSDWALQAYQHSGSWPQDDWSAADNYRAPVTVGTGWGVNDIIS